MNLETECMRLREETNMYKGKCANLARDMDIAQTYMDKVNSDHISEGDQFRFLKDRVRELEGDLEVAITEKTEALYEVKRL
jgi:transcription elongation GreA/GreB family factor